MKKILLLLTVILSTSAIAQMATTLTGSIVSNGVDRKYTLYVPTDYDENGSSVPLLFNIHGWTGTSEKQESFADFRKIADTANFIIVHPEALVEEGVSGGLGPQTSWDFVTSTDQDFLIALLDKLISEYNINTKRVYTTGFSQGSFMSYILGCGHSNRFAAAASVAGGMSSGVVSSCTPEHSVPIMHIHGTNDGLATYEGSNSNLHTDSLIKYWVDKNNCSSTPVIDSLSELSIDANDSTSVIHYVYSGGDHGSTVEFYKVIHGGHQWPSETPTAIDFGYGIGLRNKDFTASKEIWRFLSQYSLTNLGVGIEDGVVENAHEVAYPNPSNGSFTFTTEDFLNKSLKIVNALGVTVSETSLNSSSTVLNLNIPTGIYFYQMIKESVMVSSGKIVIE